MPAQNVEYPCSACEGTGYLERKACPFCTRYPSFRKLFDTPCPSCDGSGMKIKHCSSCNGKRLTTCRMWLPDSVDETSEMLRDLEQALADGTNAWPLIDAMRMAHKTLHSSKRGRLFPRAIVSRLEEIERSLPPRCSHCSGRGADAITGSRCVFCAGNGYSHVPA